MFIVYIFYLKKTTYDLISPLLLYINIIDYICGESKFAINAEQIGFDGRLVKCGKCGKEWFQESKLDIVEKKL